MEATTHGFSLLDKPWIRCLARDGSTVEVGIRDVFSGEFDLTSVRGDSPVQDYAVMRLLLAIFWRAHVADTDVPSGQTFEPAVWFESALQDASEGSADQAVLDYLTQFEDRFDLVHPETPFMQVADLHTAKGHRSEISRLIPEAEQEYFSMRAGEARKTLTLPEAARWLVYVQAFDYSGIKSGAVGDERVKGGRGYPIGPGWTGRTGGTLILGSTLRETLVLNTDPEVLSKNDLPVWERPQDTAAQRHPVTPTGPADLATWQSRRVRLFVENGLVTGVLVSNGDAIAEAGANVMGDPMTPYRYSTNKSKKGVDVYFPRPFDTERTVWQSLEPLLVLHSDLQPTSTGGASKKSVKRTVAPLRPRTLNNLGKMREEQLIADELVTLQIVSVEYGPNESTVATVVSATMDLPLSLLPQSARLQRRAVIQSAEAASNAATNLGSFAGQLAQAAGGDYEFNVGVKNAVLAELEPRFLSWLKTVTPDNYEKQATAWQEKVRHDILAHAHTLLLGAGPKALVGREEVVKDDKTRLISAGTIYQWLKKQLDESLPLTRQEDHNSEERKHA